MHVLGKTNVHATVIKDGHTFTVHILDPEIVQDLQNKDSDIENKKENLSNPEGRCELCKYLMASLILVLYFD